MREFLAQDWVTFVGVVIVLAICWKVLKSALHDGEVSQAGHHVTAFCLHCNWEGRVSRANMRCARCHHSNLSVVAT